LSLVSLKNVNLLYNVIKQGITNHEQLVKVVYSKNLVIVLNILLKQGFIFSYSCKNNFLLIFLRPPIYSRYLLTNIYKGSVNNLFYPLKKHSLKNSRTFLNRKFHLFSSSKGISFLKYIKNKHSDIRIGGFLVYSLE